VNHHIVAFFLRLPKSTMAFSDDGEDRGDVQANPLAFKTVTLEPMLYNIQLIVVLDQILNDATIRNEKEYSPIINFCAGIMSRFASNAQVNPMLPVECLFRHPVPHRFCELTTNMYVNEELRYIGEREALLEEHRRLAAAEDEEEELEGEPFRGRSGLMRASGQMDRQPKPNGSPPQDDDDDEEVEWNDEDKEEVAEKPKSSPPAASEKIDKDAVEEDDEPSSPSASEKSGKHADANEDESPSPVASEKSSKDADADEDNDERPFAPKRKLLADIDPNTSPKKKQRIPKKVQDESSDDEEEFESPPAGAPSGEAVE